jgi:hypothetical protein
MKFRTRVVDTKPRGEVEAAPLRRETDGGLTAEIESRRRWLTQNAAVVEAAPPGPKQQRGPADDKRIKAGNGRLTGRPAKK